MVKHSLVSNNKEYKLDIIIITLYNTVTHKYECPFSFRLQLKCTEKC